MVTNTTNAHRHDAVIDAVADLESLSNYTFNLVNQIDMSGLESVKIPSFSSFTINDTYATSATAASVTNDDLILTADKEKWANNQIDLRQELQNLNGNYIMKLVKATMADLKGKVEKDFLEYLAFGAGISSGSSTTFNVAADSLTTSDWRTAHASLMSRPGVVEQDLLFIIEPYAENAIRSLGTFELDKTKDGGNNIMGVRALGTLDGVPVVSTIAVPGAYDNRYDASILSITSGAVNSAYTTCSLGANHGFLAGMPVYTTGLSTDLVATGSSVITSVTSTAVVIPLTSSVTRPTPATITLNAAVNFLISREHVHFGAQRMFGFKFVDVSDKFAQNFQAQASYGRVARPGYVCRILSPYAAL